MILDPAFIHFSGVLPNKFCNDVIKHALNKKDKIARVGQMENASDEEVIKYQKIRKSNIVWIDDKWIYHTIQQFVHKANKEAGWNFEWNWSESCQFTKYNLNQYYDWHCDSLDKDKERVRKISVTCQLNDPCEYEGGELEFDQRNYHPDERDVNKHLIKCSDLKKGSVIVFPSYVWHRVKPVTKGVRYSLVVWNCGKAFK
jgi:PKHD-type hydroxylase